MFSAVSRSLSAQVASGPGAGRRAGGRTGEIAAKDEFWNIKKV